MKQFIVKESWGTNNKLDYIKINANTEAEAKKIYRESKNIKRMKASTSIYEVNDWLNSMNFNATISNKKDKDNAIAKIKFVQSLASIN